MQSALWSPPLVAVCRLFPSARVPRRMRLLHKLVMRQQQCLVFFCKGASAVRCFSRVPKISRPPSSRRELYVYNLRLDGWSLWPYFLHSIAGQAAADAIPACLLLCFRLPPPPPPGG